MVDTSVPGRPEQQSSSEELGGSDPTEEAQPSSVETPVSLQKGNSEMAMGSKAKVEETEDDAVNAIIEKVQYAAFSDHNLDQLIHRSPVFQECSYDFIETIMLHTRKKLCPPGVVIVDEGSPDNPSMFFMLWGTAVRSCMDEECGEFVEGESFGVPQFLGISKTWHWKVTAVSSCMVCELPRSCLQVALEEYPEEAEHFAAITDGHERRQQERPGYSWKGLRCCAPLKRCSEAFLRELEAHMDHRCFFRGETVVSEGTEDGTLYVLEYGAVNVEIDGRVVRTEEVPRVRTRLLYNEEYGLLHAGDRRGSENNRSGRLSTSSNNGSSEGRYESKDFRADAGSADGSSEAAQGSEDGGESIEAVAFGNQAVLGISTMRTVTVVAQRICDVRTLHRKTFLRLLANFEKDRQLVEPFLDCRQEEVFPPLSVAEMPVFGEQRFKDLGLSKAFLDFCEAHLEERMFAVGDIMTLDTFHRNIHPPLPDGNISLCRINRGRAQLFEPAVGRVTAAKLQLGEDDSELGPGSIISGDHFWKKSVIKVIETCFVTILHRGVIGRALEEFPVDRDIFMPMLATRQHMKLRAHKSERVIKILRERSIFAKTSQAFLNEIIKYGSIRVFMPGDRIIEQDTDGKSMFILWVGTANVVKEHVEECEQVQTRTLTNVGALTFGSVFGELVMLGVQSKRTASIIAGTVCCTWEVVHHRILAILDRNPIERRTFLQLVEEHLHRLAAPRIIYHQLFSGFHQQFRTLIGVNCERKLCFPGETIVREGATGDRLFIMNLGTALVEMQHQHVMQVKGGSHFGFNMICTDADRKERFPATVVTETMCQILMITRSTYQHALQKYPEMWQVAKELEAEERARAWKQRECFVRMVHRRRCLRHIIDALRGSALPVGGRESQASQPPEPLPSDKNLLESAFSSWRSVTQRSSELKREEEIMRIINSKRIDHWLSRRRHQLEQVKPQMELKRLVRKNLDERGPLKLAKKKHGFMPEYKSMRMPHRSIEEEESPYLSPSPVWRRAPMTARESSRHRLPPIGEPKPMSQEEPARAPPLVFGEKSYTNFVEDEDLEGDDIFPQPPVVSDSRRASGERRRSTGMMSCASDLDGDSAIDELPTRLQEELCEAMGLSERCHLRMIPVGRASQI